MHTLHLTTFEAIWWTSGFVIGNFTVGFVMGKLLFKVFFK